MEQARAGAVAAADRYTVASGDTLSQIANDHGIDVQELYELNRDVVKSNPDLIRPGMQLRLPAARGAVADAPTSAKRPASEPATRAQSVEDDPELSRPRDGVAAAERVHVVQFANTKYNADSAAPNGSNNCGPASLAMALGLVGIDLAQDDQGGRAVDETDIDSARRLMQGTSNDQDVSYAADVLAGAKKAGAKSSFVSSDLGKLLGAVRAGDPVALIGNPANAWPDHAMSSGKPYDGGHVVTISGHDPATGTYVVNDPLSTSGPFRASVDQVERYFSGLAGSSGVVVKQ